MDLHPDLHSAHAASPVAVDQPIISVETPPPVVPERLFDAAPILEPIPEHAWESRVVLNPAAVLVEAGEALERMMEAWELGERDRRRLRKAGGACVMLYRAQGEEHPEHRMAPSSLGLAVFTPELEPVWRRSEPVLRPEAAHHNLGLEDPRCTRVGDTYYVYYTGYTDPDPDDESMRRVYICLATTQDFVTWKDTGIAAGDVNVVNNKNSALLPEPVGGRWCLLHRPMAGPDLMTVHTARASAPDGPWLSNGQFMKSFRYHEFARTWIGAGGPPMALGDERFLMIYHIGHFTEDGTREYDLAAALLDFKEEDPVRSRIEPIMRPSGDREQVGDEALGVDNVLFTCANYRWKDYVYVPYAGADSRIFGARIPLAPLLEALERLSDVAGSNGMSHA